MDDTQSSDKKQGNADLPINWYQLMDRMMGEKRQRFTPLGTPLPGMPTPLPKEQWMIQRGFESCAFKTGLSCVGGRFARLLFVIHCVTVMIRAQ